MIRIFLALKRKKFVGIGFLAPILLLMIVDFSLVYANREDLRENNVVLTVMLGASFLAASTLSVLENRRIVPSFTGIRAPSNLAAFYVRSACAILVVFAILLPNAEFMYDECRRAAMACETYAYFFIIPLRVMGILLIHDFFDIKKAKKDVH